MPHVDANSQPASHGRKHNKLAGRDGDGLALTLLLIALLGITATSLSSGPTWQADAPARAPWCLPGQSPSFEFGFAELARHLGEVMGEPTTCERGDAWTNDTLQETTTGLAVYRWCTNTPSFTRGGEHWLLTARGVEHWTDDGSGPPAQPVVHRPNLRQPCSP